MYDCMTMNARHPSENAETRIRCLADEIRNGLMAELPPSAFDVRVFHLPAEHSSLTTHALL